MTDPWSKAQCDKCGHPHIGAPCMPAVAAVNAHIRAWNASCDEHDRERADTISYLARHGREDLQAVAVSASASGIDDGHASITSANVGADTGAGRAASTSTPPFAEAVDEELRLGETTDDGHGRPPLTREMRGALLACGHESMVAAAMLHGTEAYCPTCRAWSSSGVSL